jgi:hypothetical protein
VEKVGWILCGCWGKGRLLGVVVGVKGYTERNVEFVLLQILIMCSLSLQRPTPHPEDPVWKDVKKVEEMRSYWGLRDDGMNGMLFEGGDENTTGGGYGLHQLMMELCEEDLVSNGDSVSEPRLDVSEKDVEEEESTSPSTSPSTSNSTISSDPNEGKYFTKPPTKKPSSTLEDMEQFSRQFGCTTAPRRAVQYRPRKGKYRKEF